MSSRNFAAAKYPGPRPRAPDTCRPGSGHRPTSGGYGRGQAEIEGLGSGEWGVGNGKAGSPLLPIRYSLLPALSSPQRFRSRVCDSEGSGGAVHPGSFVRRGAERLRCRHGILGARTRTSRLASPPGGTWQCIPWRPSIRNRETPLEQRPLVNRGKPNYATPASGGDKSRRLGQAKAPTQHHLARPAHDCVGSSLNARPDLRAPRPPSSCRRPACSAAAGGTRPVPTQASARAQYGGRHASLRAAPSRRCTGTGALPGNRHARDARICTGKEGRT